MSVVKALKNLDISTAAWIVKHAIYSHLKGAERALRNLGDDGSEFRLFADGLAKTTAAEFKTAEPHNTRDYRGMICVVMDDLGFVDPVQRDEILEVLTGVSRDQEEEAFRQHRISQGDWWLIKDTGRRS